jgi:hypothetical protein
MNKEYSAVDKGSSVLPALTTAFTCFRLDIQTKNPLNGGQGFSRGAVYKVARERKKQRSMAAGHLKYCARRVPPLPVTVLLTRIAPSSGLDGDGLQASLKSVRDGVADYFATHDRDPRITWRYGQRRGRKGEYAVEIRIEKAPQRELEKATEET